MSQDSASWERLLERFEEWALSRPDIRAAVIVGSRARVDHAADEWSDLDLLVIATDPERYLSSTDLIWDIGVPWLTFVEPTAVGDMKERRVLFEGGLDVDLTFLPYSMIQQIVQDGVPPELAHQGLDIFGRGVHVLVDKDGTAAQVFEMWKSASTSVGAPPYSPTKSEFVEVINDFLYHAVWTAKKLRRGELWTAIGCCDNYMKWRLLLPMIEWHARATHGWEYDTWFKGRYLEEWADPRALEALRDAFSQYDYDYIRRALFATMNLFRWLAMETAEKLGYPYPTEADKRVTEWLRSHLPIKSTKS